MDFMVRAAVADGTRGGEAMTDASAIEAATRRLAAALDALEAALERSASMWRSIPSAP
jgi:hypothetical protein